VESCCEFCIEPTGSMKLPGNYRVASRVVFSSVELVTGTDVLDYS
jgi:hypothetical protein